MQVPILDDLLAAFDEVREEARAGGAYRTRDAEEIVQLVTRRGEALGGHLRQLVRLVRLAALCSRHVYLEFFEVTVRTTRPNALPDVIARTLAERLVAPTKVALEGGRVLFYEQAMRPADNDARAFEIAVGQVPRLAVLHHVLCRFLHYPRLCNSQAARNPSGSDEDKGLLWPVLMAAPACGADEVARRLQSALNGHLTRVFESTSHTARQVQTITGFLRSRLPVGGHSISPSDLIDNRLLLEFWETAALAGEEGFKLYRSAVTKVLRYRRALMCAQAEFSPHASLGRDTGADEVDLDRLRVDASGDDDAAGADAIVASLETGRWHSPMLALGPLFKTVKVLNETECAQLSNFLDGCAEGGGHSQDEEALGDDEPQQGSRLVHDFRLALNREFARPYGGALLGTDRFDLRLVPTLLRVDVFDPCQRSIGLRTERGDEGAIEAGLSGIGEASYRDRERAYLAIGEQLLKGMHACLYILGSLGDENALVLMARLCDSSVVAHFTRLAAGTSPDEKDLLPEQLRKDIAARLKSAFGNEAAIEKEDVRDMVRRARKATEQVRRKGFRRDQWSTDARIQAALGETAGELVRLLDEIDRLLGELRRLDKAATAVPEAGLADAAREDSAIFTDVFRRLYPVGTGAGRA
jgi:hypothetical protein